MFIVELLVVIDIDVDKNDEYWWTVCEAGMLNMGMFLAWGVWIVGWIIDCMQGGLEQTYQWDHGTRGRSFVVDPACAHYLVNEMPKQSLEANLKGDLFAHTL